MSKAEELAYTLEAQAKTMRMAGQNDAVVEAHGNAAAHLRALEANRQMLVEALRTADRTFAENGLLASHAARQEIRTALEQAKELT